MSKNTHKQRMVTEISNVIIDLVAEDNDTPSKGHVVNRIINNSLDDNASVAMHLLMEESLAEEVDKYFTAGVKAAFVAIDRPWHLVTQRFYSDFSATSFKLREKAQLTKYLACFANGRSTKAAGVRFVPVGATDDLLLALAAEKWVDNGNASILAVRSRIQGVINSGAVSIANATTLDKLTDMTSERAAIS